MRKLISLGQTCEVGFQLRQHTGDNTAHFFDWLVTPVAGLIHLIENDFPPILPQNLMLRDKGTRRSSLVDRQTKIGFAHQFPRKGKIIPENFLDDYPAFASRIEYLAARFRATVNKHPVQFVRRSIMHEEALRLEEVMQRRFPAADMRFLYINSEGKQFETPQGYSVELPPATGFGESIAWANMLLREELVVEPFRLATAQVVGSTQRDTRSKRCARPAGEIPAIPGLRMSWDARSSAASATDVRRGWRALRSARSPTIPTSLSCGSERTLPGCAFVERPRCARQQQLSNA